jgi:hypothetical protein
LQCKARSTATEKKSNTNKKTKDNITRRSGLPGGNNLARDSIKQIRENLANDEGHSAFQTHGSEANLPNNDIAK